MAKVILMVVVAVVVLAMVSSPTQGQTQPDSSCIQSLIPCQQFINVTHPPATCCGPLRQAFATQLPCLCAILKNPDLANAANVNLTQAMELPSKCGISSASDPNICSKGDAGAPRQAPAPEAGGGGGGPSTSAPGSGISNAASSIAFAFAWTGPVPSIYIMSLLLAGLMFYY